MDVISPMPMAPLALSNPGLSTTMAFTGGTSGARNNPSMPYLAVGLQLSSMGYRSVSA